MNTKTEIKFGATTEEIELIAKIAVRLQTDCPTLDRLSFTMDLDAVHSNDVKLDFGRLFAFSQFDFLHDCYGIINNIDRKTGKLKNCFVPRCGSRGNR